MKLGLTTKQMLACNVLFFYQLILPLCDLAMSGIENDPRLPYYTEVERFANMSKYESRLGGSYGYKWIPARARELVNFDRILIRDGVLGLSNGAYHYQ